MKWRSMLLAVAAMVNATGAHAAWQEASSKHFVVYSDDDPDKVRAFTAKLERFDKSMRLMRAVTDDNISRSARVTVFVVRGIGEVKRLAGRGAGDVAGFYTPRASGSVAFVPRRSGDGGQTALTPDAILFHEYAHHWMFSSMGGIAIPAWLVEGFAEFHATTTVADDGDVQVGLPPLYRAYGITDTNLVSMKLLLTADPNRLPGNARSVFYGRAWLLTHYLTFTPGGRSLLGQYLTAINEGKSPAEAAKLFGDGPALDHKLDAYALERRIKVYPIAASQLAVADVTVRALTAGEAAVMPALILSKRGVDAKTAPGVADMARRAAAPFPDSAAAQNELAEAEFDAGNYAASQSAADRALTADPKSVHALIYEGLSRMAPASKAQEHDPATWQATRQWFIKANRLDPDDPYPLELFYLSFNAARQPATANAKTGLIRAHSLAPFDPSLSLMAARVLIAQRKLDDARLALKPVAYNPHGGGASILATRTLAALDGADGQATALALLTPEGDDTGTAKAATD